MVSSRYQVLKLDDPLSIQRKRGAEAPNQLNFTNSSASPSLSLGEKLCKTINQWFQLPFRFPPFLGFLPRRPASEMRSTVPRISSTMCAVQSDPCWENSKDRARRSVFMAVKIFIWISCPSTVGLVRDSVTKRDWLGQRCSHQNPLVLGCLVTYCRAPSWIWTVVLEFWGWGGILVRLWEKAPDGGLEAVVWEFW